MTDEMGNVAGQAKDRVCPCFFTLQWVLPFLFQASAEVNSAKEEMKDGKK